MRWQAPWSPLVGNIPDSHRPPLDDAEYLMPSSVRLMKLGRIRLPKGTGQPHLHRGLAAVVTWKGDSPKDLLENAVEIWERVSAVKVHQPIVADDLIDFLLGLPEYPWVEHHA